MFKKIIFFIISFLVLTSLRIVNAQEISGEQIKNFDSRVIVNQDGTIDVTEKIEYDFSTLSKHGIFREIPYLKINQDNKKFILKFSDFSVADEAGKPYQFSKSEVNNNIRLKIGDANRLITGLHTYIISYKVSGALTYFSDHDELYWNVTGNDWTVPIVSSTSEVDIGALPQSEDNNLEKNTIKGFCYTGNSGSDEQNCQVEINAGKISVKSQGVLGLNQGLTLAVTFPKGLVAILEPKEYVDFWQTIWGKIVSALIALAALFWYLILPIYIPIRWYLAGRDPKPIGTGEVTAWYDPPKDKTGRSLTPGETGTLVDERADIREVSATIIDLARRGYLKIVEKTKKEFSLVKVKSADSQLISFEKEFLNNIFGDATEFSLKSHKMYATAEGVKDRLYKQLAEDGSFPENPQSVRARYYVLAGIALFTGNIFLAFVAFIFAGVMPKKTLFGAGQLSIAKSLKKFLGTQERQLNFQAKEQYFFEKLLPYAVAFGVEKVWLNRFKDIKLAQPEWYEGKYNTNFNSALFASSLASSLSKMSSSAMTPTRSSSGFSSGSSGGFSGGGGGGGGGGSW